MNNNPCGTNVCSMKRDGDGNIPESLQDKWEAFISKQCASVNCDRRYMTLCCKWGVFEMDG